MPHPFTKYDEERIVASLFEAKNKTTKNSIDSATRAMPPQQQQAEITRLLNQLEIERLRTRNERERQSPQSGNSRTPFNNEIAEQILAAHRLNRQIITETNPPETGKVVIPVLGPVRRAILRNPQ